MATDIALVTLETSAILLTILFIAIQYLSRQLTREDVPISTVETAANIVSITAVALVFAAFLSTWYLDIWADNLWITAMLSALAIAFITIALGIRDVAVKVRDLADDGDKPNNNDVQARIEEYHK